MRFIGANLLGSLLVLVAAQSSALLAAQEGEKGSKEPPPDKVNGKTLSEWKREMSHADASRRTVAIVTIIQFGDAASECVPQLIARLRDDDVSPRARALLALRMIAIEDKDVAKVVDAVANRLNRKQTFPLGEQQAIIRYEAVLTLQRFLEHAGPAVPLLLQASSDPASWDIRQLAVALLWKVGTSNKGVVDSRIIEGFLDRLRAEKTYQVRLELMMGLAVLGKPESPLVVNRLVTDLNTIVRSERTPRPLAIWAYAGLARMQEGTAMGNAVNSLAKYLKNPDLEVRVQAAYALGYLEGRARGKTSSLVTMLEDKENLAVVAAASALGMIGDKSESVTSALLAQLDHKEPLRAMAAVNALVQLRVNTNKVYNKFEEMLKNKDLNIRLRMVVEQGLIDIKKPKK